MSPILDRVLVTMTPTTKEAQHAELHETIWRIANDLRGSFDDWDFKTYVLGILFYRSISENLAAYLNEFERLKSRGASSLSSTSSTLLDDLSIGLPATCRPRKHYGYYRDQLLTFDEVAA